MNKWFCNHFSTILYRSSIDTILYRSLYWQQSPQPIIAAVGFEPTKHHSNSFTANKISPLSYTTNQWHCSCLLSRCKFPYTYFVSTCFLFVPLWITGQALYSIPTFGKVMGDLYTVYWQHSRSPDSNPLLTVPILCTGVTLVQSIVWEYLIPASICSDSHLLFVILIVVQL